MGFVVRGTPTEYKSVMFRSKTEARWAQYFDACNIEWQFEPAKHRLSDGRGYVPDFLLHGFVWAEVKYRNGQSAKAELFAKEHYVLLLNAEPGEEVMCLTTGEKVMV